MTHPDPGAQKCPGAALPDPVEADPAQTDPVEAGPAQAGPTGGSVGPAVVLAVALGGAIGAGARYGLQLALPTPPDGLPWATLVTNLVGCALLGALMQIVSTRIAPHRLLRPFLGSGLLGAFTTFSTYALEARDLLAAGRPGTAAGYVFGTLLGALLAVRLGRWVTARAQRS